VDEPALITYYFYRHRRKYADAAMRIAG